MRTNLLWATTLLLVVSTCPVSATSVDTARLAAHLKTIRGKMWLSAAEYQRVQTDYLNWIDARIKAGGDTASMNRELAAAGLLPRWQDTPDEMLNSHAGYLQSVSTKPVRGAKDILAITAGVYMGGGCSLNETVALYQLSPLTKLAHFSATPGEPEYAYYLSGLDVGARSANGLRLVASGWVASNCTSNWNGKRIRIDRLNGHSADNLLARDLYARDRDGTETVAASIQQDVVTFNYDGGLGDSKLMSVPAIARYRVAGVRVFREAPIALTRAGFIHEWLDIVDSEAVHWGETGAMGKRKEIAAGIAKHGFEWASVASCGGSPPIWEIALRPRESKDLYLLRISGSRATELRIVATADDPSRTCVQENIENGLANLARELPW